MSVKCDRDSWLGSSCPFDQELSREEGRIGLLIHDVEIMPCVGKKWCIFHPSSASKRFDAMMIGYSSGRESRLMTTPLDRLI